MDKDQSVESMVVERYHEMHEAVERQTILQPIAGSTSDDIKIALSMFGRGMKRKICNDTPPNKFMYRVKADEIMNRKKEYNTADSFVSTNAILCTEIFGSCDPSDGITMVVNARERIPELRGNMAGNYIFLLSNLF